MQDVRRSIDYMDSRKDIAHDTYGFLSFSWGSYIAPIVCATENRIKAAVLLAPGLMMQKTLPEVDPINYLPRINIPVLMLIGKNDAAVPLETSQRPMHRLIGTPDKDKELKEYPGGHLVPRSELIKESLNWFDKYLGRIN